MTTMLNDADPGDLRARLEAFRYSDAQRDDLVKNLIERFYHLETMFKEKCSDYDNEMQSRRMWQKDALDAKHALQIAQEGYERNPFALVLIDGDGVLFRDDFLAAGAEGGSEAAHRLFTEAKKILQDRHGNSGHWPIMVHIYANLDGLAKKLASLGIIESSGKLHAFARAFSMSQPLFNFVDVGSGKENADFKIKEMFNLFLSNGHCKHIIFGGCHDNGYLTILNQYKRDTDIAARMTLLESTPAERGYAAMGYNMVQCNSVFRNQQLPELRPFPPNNPSLIATPAVPALQELPLSRVQSNPQAPSPAATAAQASQTRSISNGSGDSLANGHSIPVAKVASPAPVTWASIGNSDSKIISIAPTKSTPPVREFISFNAQDERIDPKLPRADKEAQARLNYRIKENKVCNDYHLIGKCYNKEYCQYVHGERLEPREQLALRLKARQRPCTEGSNCRDVKCFYGHVCPNEPCFHDSCHFGSRHAESMDMKVCMRMYEDGTIERLA